MPLNNSGPISIGGSTSGQSINLELGRSATFQSSLNESTLRTLAGVASGQISLSNFYGKSNCDPYGTYISTTCSGCQRITTFADGSCGTYTTTILYSHICCNPLISLTTSLTTSEQSFSFNLTTPFTWVATLRLISNSTVCSNNQSFSGYGSSYFYSSVPLPRCAGFGQYYSVIQLALYDDDGAEVGYQSFSGDIILPA